MEDDKITYSCKPYKLELRDILVVLITIEFYVLLSKISENT